jgi:hypothetical protein
MADGVGLAEGAGVAAPDGDGLGSASAALGKEVTMSAAEAHAMTTPLSRETLGTAVLGRSDERLMHSFAFALPILYGIHASA